VEPTPTVSELVAELRELRRGHGLFADDSPRRAGPGVRRQCGVENSDSDAVVRNKLLLHLTDVAAQLPDFVRPAVEAALALHPQARQRFLHQRMGWAAEQVNRDHVRTVNRRLDQGLQLLAELLLLTTVPDSTPAREWHTLRLDSVLRMDLDPPLLTETRTLRALIDDLDELKTEVSAPQDDAHSGPTRVRAEVVYGGEIVERDLTSRHYASFVIRLPEPLAVGEQHEYSMQFSGPSRAQMRPYYVLTPYRRCDHFTVRIRFSPDSFPERIWRVDGMPTRRVDDFSPTDQLLRLDSIGEVGVSFSSMQQGLSYGVQWKVRE
jgi:hypothetical protein